MAKMTITTFKKHISNLKEEQLRSELEGLYKNVKEVRDLYANMLGAETSKKAPNPKLIDEYKKKIYNQFWTRGGNPRDNPSNADIRKYISEFEKLGFLPSEVADVIFYRVETITIYADMFGGTREGDYNASVNAFEKVVKLISQYDMKEQFEERYEKLIAYDNLDYWYIEQLKEVWEEYL